jgi:hypothetical protein
MNIADFPHGYANIQLRRTDYVPPRILGNFHDEEIALASLRSSHAFNPLATYDLCRDGVVIAALPEKKKTALRLLKKAS